MCVFPVDVLRMSLATAFSFVPQVDTETNTVGKYEVLEILGEGFFGKVTNRSTKEIVAIKMMKKDRDIFHQELEMLGCIKELDPDSFNLVKFIDYDFDLEDHQCLVFEILDISVFDLLQEKSSFSLNQIRPMAKQLLIALHGLQLVGVIHTDLKPDNIMLVNHKEQPFKVKLIDFGVAKCRDQVMTGQSMQPTCFCSPEVMLGLPLWEAVDMWSLACILVLCYLGDLDFRAYSEFEYLSNVVQFFGQPPEHLLHSGVYTWKYFVFENSKWRLKTLQEFKESTGETPEISGHKPSSANLEQLIKISKKFESNLEQRDREAFHDLLEKMFKMDAEVRITPSKALLHPFISMEHLPEGALNRAKITVLITAIIESILTSSITVWYAGATVRDRLRLQRIVRSAEKVIGCSLPSLQDLYVSRTRGRAECAQLELRLTGLFWDCCIKCLVGLDFTFLHAKTDKTFHPLTVTGKLHHVCEQSVDSAHLSGPVQSGFREHHHQPSGP
ncbi:hypothetical protein WMY93_012147 [Mugilogobius chulae]|uniref:Protein kinase domain-containing protein n=1 Tax=Mugilogobius chulae TaxID=88201 RepID=A0AAW0PAC0_9GOBI